MYHILFYSINFWIQIILLSVVILVCVCTKLWFTKTKITYLKMKN